MLLVRIFANSLLEIRSNLCYPDHPYLNTLKSSRFIKQDFLLQKTYQKRLLWWNCFPFLLQWTLMQRITFTCLKHCYPLWVLILYHDYQLAGRFRTKERVHWFLACLILLLYLIFQVILSSFGCNFNFWRNDTLFLVTFFTIWPYQLTFINFQASPICVFHPVVLTW